MHWFFFFVFFVVIGEKRMEGHQSLLHLHYFHSFDIFWGQFWVTLSMLLNQFGNNWLWANSPLCRLPFGFVQQILCISPIILSLAPTKLGYFRDRKKMTKRLLTDGTQQRQSLTNSPTRRDWWRMGHFTYRYEFEVSSLTSNIPFISCRSRR